MKLRSILALAFVLATTGCVSVKHRVIDADARAALSGRSLVVTRHETPDFSAMTAGKAGFGLIGAAAMISAGNTIVRENAIPDPAVGIADALAERLVAAHAMQRQASDAVVDGTKPAELLATYPQGDYVLDVRTLNWGFVYYPSKWDRYRVPYSAQLRLIDRRTGAVVAETGCASMQGDDANPPSKDELLADEAALLKTYMANIVTACSDVFAREVLAL